MLNTPGRLTAALLLVFAFASQANAATPLAYDFSFTAINGNPMPFSAYRGKALLVVNTASFCGYTPQYRGLEALWQSYKDKGLMLVGVPSDSFNQEYDNNADIKTFCETNYTITFPLTERTAVKGPDAHPFYAWVKQQSGGSAVPGWNFNKILIDAHGRFVRIFPSKVEPGSKVLRQAIDAALPPQ